MNHNTQKLFLIDSLGALLSAILLGFVLTRYEIVFGMPRNVLYFLSAIAGALAIFSFMRFLLVNQNQNGFLKGIAIANLIYVCLTIGLVFYFYRELTSFGLIYFISELIVIILLAMLEWKTASKKNN